jgi:outer membrane lipoprotein SlyB
MPLFGLPWFLQEKPMSETKKVIATPIQTTPVAASGVPENLFRTSGTTVSGAIAGGALGSIAGMPGMVVGTVVGSIAGAAIGAYNAFHDNRVIQTVKKPDGE